jgi:uncharacterized protein YeaO (DUF488 family)
MAAQPAAWAHALMAAPVPAFERRGGQVPYCCVGGIMKTELNGVQSMIKVKRAYDSVEPEDGIRFLVDRLWPRGIRKEEMKVSAWLKDVAPSTDLRRWFGHDPAKWNEFRRRYFSELEKDPNVWRPIVEAQKNGAVTLVYGANDEAHNNAVALRDFLITRSARRNENT